MKAWTRMGLLPGWVWLATAAVIAVIDSAGLAVWFAFGVVANVFLLVPVVVCSAFGGLLGWRRWQRYPDPGSNYADWLQSTPWCGGKRLPFGPWHPVLSDLAVLAVPGAVAAGHAGLQFANVPIPAVPLLPGVVICALLPAIGFIAAWLVLSYLTVAKMWGWSIFAVAFGSGCIWHIGVALGAQTAAILLPAVMGAAVVLVWRRMAWTLDQLPQACVLKTTIQQPRAQTAGTAFDVLAPKLDDRLPWARICRWRTPVRTVAGCALVFVWAAAVPVGETALFMWTAVAGFAGLLRVALVADRQRTHLTAAARWKLRKPVVLEYDWIWLVPVVMVAVVYAVFRAAEGLGLPQQITAGTGAAAAFAIGVMSGPEAQRWRLTVPCQHWLRKPGRGR